MNENIENMAAYICDDICRHANNGCLVQEQLDDICSQCKFNDYIKILDAELDKKSG